MRSRSIYLDANASTPLDERVLATMAATLREAFGNPASDHAAGRAASYAIEAARADVAALVGCDPDEIVFTGGATEAINIALAGAVRAAVNKPVRVITSVIEHRAVHATLEQLAGSGEAVVHVLDVDECGRVSLDDLRSALTHGPALVVLGHANNEIGTIQDVAAAAELTRAASSLLFVDAVQTGAFFPPSVACGIDLLCISAHKMHGPKGVGALFVRRGVELQPLFHGGGQEQGLRPGTPNVAGIAAFGVAARIARTEGAERAIRVREMRDTFVDLVCAEVPGVTLNGDEHQRTPSNISLTIAGVEGAALRRLVPDVAFSQGSACATASGRPSHVLRAIGLSDAECAYTVRFGVSALNEHDELEEAARAVIDACRQLRPASAVVTRRVPSRYSRSAPPT